MRALIVDDSTAIRCYLRKILTPCGFEVFEARNGREGLERLREQPGIELVLLDWNMPVMNGIDLLQQIRSDPGLSGVCVMMVTTENDLKEISQALELGANEYLMKPFTPNMISDKLALLGFPVPAA